MKRFFKYLLPIMVLVITMSALFISCDKPIDKEVGLKELNEACVNTLKATTYYARTVEGNYEYSVNMWPDDGSLEGVDKSRCKFTKTDNSNILKAVYEYYYYGASLPSTISKEKNATVEDYKRCYFRTENSKIVLSEDVKSMDEFLQQDVIKKYTVDAIVGSVEKINEENCEIVSITRVGHVTEYIIKPKVSFVENANSKDLFAECSKDKNEGIVIRVADGKLSMVSVTKLNGNGEVDKNSKAKFSNYISYVGPNVKLTGKDGMPHYDNPNGDNK